MDNDTLIQSDRPVGYLRIDRDQPVDVGDMAVLIAAETAMMTGVSITTRGHNDTVTVNDLVTGWVIRVAMDDRTVHGILYGPMVDDNGHIVVHDALTMWYDAWFRHDHPGQVALEMAAEISALIATLRTDGWEALE